MVGASQRLSGLQLQKLLAQRQPSKWQVFLYMVFRHRNIANFHAFVNAFTACAQGMRWWRRSPSWQMGRKKSSEVSTVDLVERRGQVGSVGARDSWSSQQNESRQKGGCSLILCILFPGSKLDSQEFSWTGILK